MTSDSSNTTLMVFAAMMCFNQTQNHLYVHTDHGPLNFNLSSDYVEIIQDIQISPELVFGTAR